MNLVREGVMTKPTVVIIESDENARYLYNIALKFQQLDVLTAKTVADGMKKVRQVKPDLLLIDQVVPDLVNHNVIKELEKITPDNMPIIIATNLQDGEHKNLERIKILKAFEYLVAGKHTVGDLIKTARKAIKL
jgi:DNA-binding NtrC family response regulator